MGNELTKAIQAQLPEIPLLCTGIPSLQRQGACTHLQKPLQIALE